MNRVGLKSKPSAWRPGRRPEGRPTKVATRRSMRRPGNRRRDCPLTS